MTHRTRDERSWRRDDGSALILALLSGMLLSAFGLALTLGSAAETMIAANAQRTQQARYAADAIVDRTLSDLAALPRWTVALAPAIVPECAAVRSSFAGFCGVSSDLILTLPETNQAIDLGAATDALQAASDTANQWGANNPVWRLYAFGPLRGLVPMTGIDSAICVALWIADDPAETDGDPLADGNGVLMLHAEAYGPSATKQAIDATVARPEAGHPGVRVIARRPQ
jgi:Tfp pilus assembly protein PilX